jgi:uncharacterized protein
MSGVLPVSVDPVRLADQSAQLRGVLPVARMRRLTELCGSDFGEAQVDLRFVKEADSGLRRLQGQIRAMLDCRCERCLERFRLPVQADVSLRIVSPGERGWADDSDALEADGPMALSEIVENELILALPMVPMHPQDQCPAAALLDGQTGKQEPSSIRQENPFGALAALRKKGDEEN